MPAVFADTQRPPHELYDAINALRVDPSAVYHVAPANHIELRRGDAVLALAVVVDAQRPGAAGGEKHDVGGVPVLMKALLDGGYLHGDCMTVTGKTIAENLKGVVFPTGQDVVHPTAQPLAPTGGLVVLKGNLAPQGAIVKVAGMKRLRFTGPALCFDREEDAFAAVEGRRYKEGDVIKYTGISQSAIREIAVSNTC